MNNQLNSKLLLEKKKLKEVKQLKYKFLVFLSLVIIYFFYPYVIWLYNNLTELEKQISTLNTQKTQLKIENWQYKNLQLVLEQINKNKFKEIFKKCIYHNIWCKKIKEKFKEFTPFKIDQDRLRAYYLISIFSGNSKLDFDQKTILKDIKLLTSQIRWHLNIINFWKVSNVDKALWLYKLPFDLNITFANGNELKKFIDKLENKLSFINNLYFVDKLNYDIMKANEEMTITLKMVLYFYK